MPEVCDEQAEALPVVACTQRKTVVCMSGALYKSQQPVVNTRLMMKGSVKAACYVSLRVVTARVKRQTYDAVPLLHPVQLLQLLQHVHSVVQEVDDHRDEDTKGEAPGSSCCCTAVGGVSATCQYKQPVKADQMARQGSV